MRLPPPFKIFDSLASLPAAAWNRLAGDNPFLRHEFLWALEQSGCATPATGWDARFLTLWQGETLTGAMPLYLKSHSWGEFVFDWAWADAYQRHGVPYYPKLVSAAPFTPATGPRLLAETAAQQERLIHGALQLAQELGVSSLHCLFPSEAQAAQCERQGMMRRSGVQFHWHNRDYADFDAFLATFSHGKRKKIKQERRKVRDAGITFQRLEGAEITPADWAFFHRCYLNTHHRYQAPPSLNLDFFQRIGDAMPENLLLIVARRDGRPIAAAINLRNAHTLYGRHWGALESWPGLHFETCYYQALDYCIAHQLQVYEAGAQGEHKLARGFLPVTTWSAHWLAHAEFSDAVAYFLARETQGVGRYIDELTAHSPFRKTLPE